MSASDRVLALASVVVITCAAYMIAKGLLTIFGVIQ